MLIGEGLTGPAFPESRSIQIRSVRSERGMVSLGKATLVYTLCHESQRKDKSSDNNYHNWKC